VIRKQTRISIERNYTSARKQESATVGATIMKPLPSNQVQPCATAFTTAPQSYSNPSAEPERNRRNRPPIGDGCVVARVLGGCGLLYPS
jgi:hypothetical protein